MDGRLKVGAHPEMSRSLDKAQKEARVHDQLGELQSTHFILRYDQKVSDQRLGQQILTTLEGLYGQLSNELTSRPPATIAVICIRIRPTSISHVLRAGPVRCSMERFVFPRKAFPT